MVLHSDPLVAGSRTLLCFAMLINMMGSTAPAMSSPTVENTQWTLTRLANRPFKPLRRQPFLLLDSATRRVSGFAGCNEFAGRYMLSDRRLTFQRISYTRKACLETVEASVESRFFEALSRVRYWRVDGAQLVLLDGAGNRRAQFKQDSPRIDSNMITPGTDGRRRSPRVTASMDRGQTSHD